MVGCHFCMEQSSGRFRSIATLARLGVNMAPWLSAIFDQGDCVCVGNRGLGNLRLIGLALAELSAFHLLDSLQGITYRMPQIT